MFGILKKKLRESVEGLVKKVETETAETPGEPPEKKEPEVSKEKPATGRPEKRVPEEEPEPSTPPAPTPAPVYKEPETAEEVPEKESAPEPEEKKRGLFRKIREKEFSGDEIDGFFADIEAGLLQANLALEVIDYLKSGLKDALVSKAVSRKDARKVIIETFEKLLLGIVRQGDIDMQVMLKEKKPVTILFLGFNGSGKTTTIAKVADMLIKQGKKPVLAAADTFRAASIEQLEVHAKRLNLNVIKHDYGSDPAAVVFDARKHAESKGLDFVLADSAGRMHTDVNLMDELKKIVRVNKPDLKVLVVDSLTGNDVVSQVREFNEHIGIDALVLTKMDVNEKGGSIITACYTSKKPVMFIGTGQEYDCLEKFEPEKFVKNLLE